jgi:hypothetical protein
VSGVIPMRPLTLGELLDSAVALLRGHARVFIGAGLILAAAEQALLYPLRAAAATQPPFFLPYADRLGQYWVLICVGLAAETTIISMLGGLTARVAGPALLGQRLPNRRLIAVRGSRFGSVLLIAAIVGVVALIAALAGIVPWIIVYALVGLAVPTLVIDRVNPVRALGRSVVLAARGALRTGSFRLTGYVAWLAVRIALGTGSIALVRIAFSDADPDLLRILAALVGTGVNAVAYPVLACLDAVLHLESRMRTEGLDITLSRARAAGRPDADLLALPRGPA